LRRAILTAVRNGYTGAVDKAAERMKEIEEKYNLPTPENFLDFCDEKQVRKLLVSFPDTNNPSADHFQYLTRRRRV